MQKFVTAKQFGQHLFPIVNFCKLIVTWPSYRGQAYAPATGREKGVKPHETRGGGLIYPLSFNKIPKLTP